MSINEPSSFQLPEITNPSVKRKAEKGKGGRPKMPIWDNYNEEAYLALHCKGQVPDDIRKKWLIEVAKRGEKVNDEKDAESPIRKKNKTTNQSITLHY
ncbi:42214_t:CDS:2 [Gigaspora margarita]|uniref:42214_t:CDS:1 n=1 Tax=Gigaspora margarita TaxID=4874 RepID=A0ABN7X529_GIGMA|nr:42214_t:CDS:2 [Gigaspora margarita]